MPKRKLRALARNKAKLKSVLLHHVIGKKLPAAEARELLPNCVLCVPVLAYLDPGTGSMLVQLVVGGLAAVAVTAKFYWRRVLRLLRIRKPEPEPEQER